MNWPAMESSVDSVCRFTGATAAYGTLSAPARGSTALVEPPARTRLTTIAAKIRQTTATVNTSTLCRRQTCMKILTSAERTFAPESAQRESLCPMKNGHPNRITGNASSLLSKVRQERAEAEERDADRRAYGCWLAESGKQVRRGVLSAHTQPRGKELSTQSTEGCLTRRTVDPTFRC